MPRKCVKFRNHRGPPRGVCPVGGEEEKIMDNGEYRERRPEEVPEDGTETGGAMDESVRPIRPITKGYEERPCPYREAGRLSFRKAYEAAWRQIGGDRLTRNPFPGWVQLASTRPQVEAICRVMADMMIKPKATVVYIAGEPMRAEDVAEVYTYLDERAISDVLDRLDGVAVVRAMPYLRTVLYNAAIEGGSFDGPGPAWL